MKALSTFRSRSPPLVASLARSNIHISFGCTASLTPSEIGKSGNPAKSRAEVHIRATAVSTSPLFSESSSGSGGGSLKSANTTSSFSSSAGALSCYLSAPSDPKRQTYQKILIIFNIHIEWIKDFVIFILDFLFRLIHCAFRQKRLAQQWYSIRSTLLKSRTVRLSISIVCYDPLTSKIRVKASAEIACRPLMTASMTNRSGRGEMSISLPVATIGGPGNATFIGSTGSILARFMASRDDSASAGCFPSTPPARPSRLALLSDCSVAKAVSILSFCFVRASFI
jgi:hypothetical protein